MEENFTEAVQGAGGESQAVELGCVETQSGKRGEESAKTCATIRECIEAYECLGSVVQAAELLGIREDTLRRRLVKEARKRGLADIRMLKGDGGEDSADITQAALLKLIEDQAYRCKLSGVELTPDMAVLDHVIPVSKGGRHTAENVAWVHSEINRMKGQLSVEEFVSLCRKVVQYTR